MTTRRALIGGLAALPVTTIAPHAAILPPHPDTELMRLGRRWKGAADDDERDELCDRIARTPATTLDGLLLKARVASTVLGGGHTFADLCRTEYAANGVTIAFLICRDLLAIENERLDPVTDLAI